MWRSVFWLFRFSKFEKDYGEDKLKVKRLWIHHQFQDSRLIQVADVVAREKSIEREEVMLAMEEAIQRLVEQNMDLIVISGR